MEGIVNDVVFDLEALKDIDRLAFAEKSYPTKMKIIGVSNPNVDLVLKTLKKTCKRFVPGLKLDVVKALFDSNIHECQLLALKFIDKDKKLRESLVKEDVLYLNKNMDNWVSVDTFGTYVYGYAWRVNILGIDDVLNLQKSKDVWQRRLALVATIALNQKSRGGKGDLKQTLEICRKAVNDQEDMVVKALSWALRELLKTGADETQASLVDKEVRYFINEYKGVLNKKIIREVKGKLS